MLLSGDDIFYIQETYLISFGIVKVAHAEAGIAVPPLLSFCN